MNYVKRQNRQSYEEIRESQRHYEIVCDGSQVTIGEDADDLEKGRGLGEWGGALLKGEEFC